MQDLPVKSLFYYTTGHKFQSITPDSVLWQNLSELEPQPSSHQFKKTRHESKGSLRPTIFCYLFPVHWRKTVPLLDCRFHQHAIKLAENSARRHNGVKQSSLIFYAPLNASPSRLHPFSKGSRESFPILSCRAESGCL